MAYSSSFQIISTISIIATIPLPSISLANYGSGWSITRFSLMGLAEGKGEVERGPVPAQLKWRTLL
jgi:hypothetical protein